MLIYVNMKLTRPYVMRARAGAAAVTRRRILDAAVDELWCKRVTDVHLEDIASKAQVTVQTVLRVFGCRAALIDAAWNATRNRIMARRHDAAPGDIAGTVRALFDH